MSTYLTNLGISHYIQSSYLVIYALTLDYEVINTIDSIQKLNNNGVGIYSIINVFGGIGILFNETGKQDIVTYICELED